MKNNIRRQVIVWNNRFPLDRWWRKKYNIAYLSNDHRESTFFCHCFEYFEEKVFEEYFAEQDKEKTDADIYLPMTGDWWRGKKDKLEEIDDWFDIPLE